MSLGCKTPDDVIKAMRDNDVKHLDLRFTDPRGKWQHTAQHVSTVDEDMLTDGVMFDGSSIAGWRISASTRRSSRAPSASWSRSCTRWSGATTWPSSAGSCP